MFSTFASITTKISGDIQLRINLDRLSENIAPVDEATRLISRVFPNHFQHNDTTKVRQLIQAFVTHNKLKLIFTQIGEAIFIGHTEYEPTITSIYAIDSVKREIGPYSLSYDSVQEAYESTQRS